MINTLQKSPLNVFTNLHLLVKACEKNERMASKRFGDHTHCKLSVNDSKVFRRMITKHLIHSEHNLSVSDAYHIILHQTLSTSR